MSPCPSRSGLKMMPSVSLSLVPERTATSLSRIELVWSMSDVELVTRGGADDRVRQLREVDLTQFRDREADDARLARSQSPCRQIGAVVQLGDGGEDAVPGGCADVGIVVDDVRHRLDRHAGYSCHVMQG